MFGIDLGEFDAEVCNACGETFLDEAQMAELEQRARRAGVWGLGQKVKVAKSGNSLVLRIPADLARFLKLKAGTEVFLHPDGEARIVVDVEG
ncbi:MAG: AbrB/MazE/SpoVT family DNA-binding domain-containing protein [Thermoplasmatota archaeon]